MFVATACGLGTVSTDMEAPPLERKLVAILAADVEGYSRMMEVDEEGTLLTLSAHRTITDELIAQHSGRIFGTAGDSVLAEFASVFSAVQCAIEIQQELAIANEPLDEARAAALPHRHQCRRRHGEGRRHLRRRRQYRRTSRRRWPSPAASAFHAACATISATSCRTSSRISASRRSRTSPSRCAASASSPAQASPSRRRRTSRSRCSPSCPRRRKADDQTVELVFWELIKDSQKPSRLRGLSGGVSRGQLRYAGPCPARRVHRSGRRGARPGQPRHRASPSGNPSARATIPNSLQAYLDKYPAGEFCALAEIRLKELGETPATAK